MLPLVSYFLWIGLVGATFWLCLGVLGIVWPIGFALWGGVGLGCLFSLWLILFRLLGSLLGLCVFWLLLVMSSCVKRLMFRGWVLVRRVVIVCDLISWVLAWVLFCCADCV